MLIDDFTSPCVMIDRHTSSDGEGGIITTWEEGAPIEAAITFDTSMESRIADRQGVTSRYTVTAKKTLVLQYHDVFKRIKDGKIFRVTSDGDDKFAPVSATLDMRQVTAEEWSLPND